MPAGKVMTFIHRILLILVVALVRGMSLRAAALNSPADFFGAHVIVQFTGVCTFVHASDNPQPNEPMVLELMEGRKKALAHFPVAIYSKDDEVTPPTDRSRLVVGDQKYFEFNGDLLSIAEPISPPSLTYDPSPPDCAISGNSFGYVTHLGDVAKAKASAKATLTLADLDPRFVGNTMSPDYVAAALPINAGAITTTVANNVVWAFRTRNPFSGKYHTQRIAQVVRWEFDVPNDTLTLMTTHIGSGHAPTQLVQLKADAGTISLTIANVMDSDVKLLTTGVGASDRPDSVDSHFSDMYYDFIKNWNGPRPRPVAYAVCVGNPPKESTDECDLNKAVILHPPSTVCLLASQSPPLTIGGLNCGPDQIP
jgi:hypothetical protein